LHKKVYFFRWVIHNYSNPYAVRILKNLIPALKPGARIIINDHCLREPGQENPWDERVMRRMDVVMLALLNAQERTEAEFRELFAAADERFVFKVCLCYVQLVEKLVTDWPGLLIGCPEAQGLPDEYCRGCLAAGGGWESGRSNRGETCYFWGGHDRRSEIGAVLQVVGMVDVALLLFFPTARYPCSLCFVRNKCGGIDSLLSVGTYR
jgi:hypothetical protein